MADDIKNILKVFEKDSRFAKKNLRLANEIPPVDVIPTGVEEFDNVVLGIGGIPRGKITTLWGPYECGKSTFAGAIIANMQKNNNSMYGGTAALFDSEGKFHPDWWRDWGVDLNRLIMGDFDCGEEAFDQMMMLFGKVDIIVVDSIAALSSKEKATRGEDKVRMGAEARMIKEKIMDVKNGTFNVHKSTGQIIGVRTPKLGDTGTALILINQVRANIGVMFGRKEKMPGGNINKHLQSLLIRTDIVGYGAERDQFGGIIRQKVRLKCERNHYAPPSRYCDVWLNVEEKAFEPVKASYILNLGVDAGILEQRGSWIYSEDLPDGKVQGLNQLLDFLQTKDGEKLKSKILDGKNIDLEDHESEDFDLGVDSDTEEGENDEGCKT